MTNTEGNIVWKKFLKISKKAYDGSNQLHKK